MFGYPLYNLCFLLICSEVWISSGCFVVRDGNETAQVSCIMVIHCVILQRNAKRLH
jgi:hypothetical protein